MHLLSELKIQFFFKYVGRLGNQQTDQIRLKTMDMIVLAINKLSLSRKKKEKKLLDLEYNLIVNILMFLNRALLLLELKTVLKFASTIQPS